MEDGQSVRTDHKRPLRGVAGVHDSIFKFWDSLITFERIVIFASNLVERWSLEDAHSVRMDHKANLCGRGRGHVTQFQNNGTLITFERIELFASNLVERWRTDPSCVWAINDPKWARLGSRDQILKLWKPPYDFGTNEAVRFKFGRQIVDDQFMRTGHK